MVASETGGCEGGRCSGWRVSGRTGAMLGPGGDALSPARVVTASLILAFPNLPPALSRRGLRSSAGGPGSWPAAPEGLPARDQQRHRQAGEGPAQRQAAPRRRERGPGEAVLERRPGEVLGEDERRVAPTLGRGRGRAGGIEERRLVAADQRDGDEPALAPGEGEGVACLLALQGQRQVVADGVELGLLAAKGEGAGQPPRLDRPAHPVARRVALPVVVQQLLARP